MAQTVSNIYAQKTPRLAKAIQKKFGKSKQEANSTLAMHRMGVQHATNQISMAFAGRKSGRDSSIMGNHGRMGGHAGHGC